MQMLKSLSNARLTFQACHECPDKLGNEASRHAGHEGWDAEVAWPTQECPWVPVRI